MLTTGIIAPVTSTWRAMAILFLTGVVGLGLAACGDDDDSTVVGDVTSTTETTEHAMGSDDDAADEEAPLDENPCAPGGSGQLPGMAAMAPDEGATPVTITATEYAFGGTDALEGGGNFAITFENDGKELHELHVAKVDDDEKRSMQDLLKDRSGEEHTSEVGHTFACPGTAAAPAGIDLSEPGRYFILCFVPTGATPETDPRTFGQLGPPHAFGGMAVEIVVEA